MLGDITELSQISCSFYSLESRFGIKYFVDLLLTANGSAHSGILILVGSTQDGVWVLPALCSGMTCTEIPLDSEEASACCCTWAQGLAGASREGWLCGMSKKVNYFSGADVIQHFLFTITQDV